MFNRAESLYEHALRCRESGDEKRCNELLRDAAAKGYAPAEYEYGMSLFASYDCYASDSVRRQSLLLVNNAAKAGYEPAIRRIAQWLFPLDCPSGLAYIYPSFYRASNWQDRRLWTSPSSYFCVGDYQLSTDVLATLQEVLGNDNLDTRALRGASISYYQRLANMGDAEAFYCSAIVRLACIDDITATGSGERRAIQAALEELSQAIKSDVPQALFVYGALIDSGCIDIEMGFGNSISNEARRKAAAQYYLLAAEQGFAPAQWLAALAMIDGVLERGQFNPVDLLYECEEQEEKASYNLGEYFYQCGEYDQARYRLEKYLRNEGTLDLWETINNNLMVGYMRLGGLGGRVDEDGALDCFCRAHSLDAKNDYVTLQLAKCYLARSEMEQAYETLASIKARNAEAAYIIGQCHEKGWGVEQSERDALAAYSVDILADCPDALFARARILSEQKDCDREEVNSLYRRGAECGGAMCQAMWGEALEEGLGCATNHTQALYWLEKSANQGCVYGLKKLAKVLLEEDGLHNRDRAQALLEDAVAQSDNESKVMLAQLYDKNGEFERAYQLFSELSDEGELEGYFGKACHLFRGLGVAISEAEAVPLYEAAARGGHPKAMYFLGDCYMLGRGTTPDEVRGAGLYEQASAAGVIEAQFQYARCLLRGKGVDRDEKRGRELIAGAAKAGYGKAVEWISRHGQKNADPLDDLVGLEEVKKEIRGLRKRIVFEQAVAAQGKTLASSNHHMLFLGNPGTGKTTVARIVADLLYDMGVISSRTLVEVDRSQLVGKYWGEGLQKTREAIDKAKGGVLFIDEAYALKQLDDDGLGGEVIDTLVKAMTDHADNFVVIMAGYEREMRKFLDSNSGLRSRFRYTFHFSDYSAEQLAQIFRNLMTKQGFIIDSDAMGIVFSVFERACHQEHFGNGRFVANFAESVIEHHMNVTFDSNDPSTTLHIVAADIPVDKAV